jgi:hypothetical protein
MILGEPLKLGSERLRPPHGVGREVFDLWEQRACLRQ